MKGTIYFYVGRLYRKSFAIAELIPYQGEVLRF